MTNKQTKILILLALYLVTISGLTIYHAFNFSNYVHTKGDGTVDYTLFLLITSILMQGLIWIVTHRFDWKAAILATILNFLCSFIIGFVIVLVAEMNGTPKQIILVYGGCYLTFFTAVTILQALRLREA